MPVFRLFALSLLGSVLIPAAAMAQSVQSPSSSFSVPDPFSSHREPTTPNPAFDFRSHAPAFLPNPKAGNQLSPSFAVPNPFASAKAIPQLLDRLREMRLSMGRGALTARSEQLCYAMRDYRFTRGTPDLDVTKPSGYSTCQPANQFQVKTIVAAPALLR